MVDTVNDTTNSCATPLRHWRDVLWKYFPLQFQVVYISQYNIHKTSVRSVCGEHVLDIAYSNKIDNKITTYDDVKNQIYKTYRCYMDTWFEQPTLVKEYIGSLVEKHPRPWNKSKTTPQELLDANNRLVFQGDYYDKIMELAIKHFGVDRYALVWDMTLVELQSLIKAYPLPWKYQVTNPSHTIFTRNGRQITTAHSPEYQVKLREVYDKVMKHFFLDAIPIKNLPWHIDDRYTITSCVNKELILDLTKEFSKEASEFYKTHMGQWLSQPENATAYRQLMLQKHPKPWTPFRCNGSNYTYDANREIVYYANNPLVSVIENILNDTDHSVNLLEEEWEIKKAPIINPYAQDCAYNTPCGSSELVDGRQEIVSTHETLQPLPFKNNVMLYKWQQSHCKFWINIVLPIHPRPWRLDLANNTIVDALNKTIETTRNDTLQLWNILCDESTHVVFKQPDIVDCTEIELDMLITKHPLPWQLSDDKKSITDKEGELVLWSTDQEKVLASFAKGSNYQLIYTINGTHPFPWSMKQDSNYYYIKDCKHNTFWQLPIEAKAKRTFNHYMSNWVKSQDKTFVKYIQDLTNKHHTPWQLTYCGIFQKDILVDKYNVSIPIPVNDKDILSNIMTFANQNTPYELSAKISVIDMTTFNLPWRYEKGILFSNCGKCLHNVTLEEFTQLNKDLDFVKELTTKHPLPWTHNDDNITVQDSNNVVVTLCVLPGETTALQRKYLFKLSQAIHAENTAVSTSIESLLVNHPKPWRVECRNDFIHVLDGIGKRVITKMHNKKNIITAWFNKAKELHHVDKMPTFEELVKKHPLPWDCSSDGITLSDNKYMLILSNRNLKKEIAQLHSQAKKEHSKTFDISLFSNAKDRPWKKIDNEKIVSKNGDCIVSRTNQFYDVDVIWERAVAMGFDKPVQTEVVVDTTIYPSIESLLVNHPKPWYLHHEGTIRDKNNATILIKDNVATFFKNACETHKVQHADFESLLKQHPTPWTFNVSVFTSNSVICDANLEPVIVANYNLSDHWGYAVSNHKVNEKPPAKKPLFTKKEIDKLIAKHPKPWRKGICGFEKPAIICEKTQEVIACTCTNKSTIEELWTALNPYSTEESVMTSAADKFFEKFPKPWKLNTDVFPPTVTASNGAIVLTSPGTEDLTVLWDLLIPMVKDPVAPTPLSVNTWLKITNPKKLYCRHGVSFGKIIDTIHGDTNYYKVQLYCNCMSNAGYTMLTLTDTDAVNFAVLSEDEAALLSTNHACLAR